MIFLFDLVSDPNVTENLADVNKTVMKLTMKKIRSIMKSGKVVKPYIQYMKEKVCPTILMPLLVWVDARLSDDKCFSMFNLPKKTFALKLPKTCLE